MSQPAVDSTVSAERERFLADGVLPGHVRPEILNSWRRCSSWSVRPGGIDPPYRPDFNPDSRLMRAARPVLEQVAERLSELGIVFLLTDSEARILARSVSEHRLLGRLDSVHATPGHVFAEDAVGTNGLGTAVELGRTTRIDGHEHYIADLRPFTCVGVPIVDPIERRPAGILDVTCAADQDNKLVELIAEQTARAIEARLADQRTAIERTLLEHFLTANRHGSGGIVVISERLLMTDPRAARLLSGVEQALIWERAARALRHRGPVNETIGLVDGSRATARMTALHSGTDQIGVLMELRAPPDNDRPPPVDDAVPIRPDQSLGLVGRHPRFLEACRACRSAAAAGRVVLIGGEPGVGKFALASAVHRQRSAADPSVLHAAAVPLESGGWLPALRQALAGPVDTLILRAVHLLPESELGPTCALLEEAVNRGWRCLVTHSGTRSTGAVLPELDAATVTLPPLRNRLEDLPRLVAAFAAPRRVSPEAVQLLIRLPWRGNIRELRAVVRRMLATAGARTPGLGDIPTEVRRAAPRRELTRFEHAEVHAILDALAEADGNKKDAAKLLGISRSTLYRKLQAAGFDLTNTAY